ncbi:cell division protein FtsQ [Desulfatitalea tepidiphila]|uniref:cell division protein FtsQ n=1 Tax=Desulfatitalea tepidiphila TaxID=1185843 RepID=UPI0006B62FE9|nr:cell division protein FtsQ [Desulfatitalea tepidiphila]
MKFSETTTVALIALSGVLVSAFVSYIVSSNQADLTVNNLKVELESRFNQKLYEKRLEAYPSLYKVLSDLGKDLRAIDLPYSKLKNRLNEIDKWDSSNAILLSHSGIVNILELRNILDENTNWNPKYEPDAQVNKDLRQSIFDATLKLEEQLKEEIGIYDAEGYHNPPLSTMYPHSWKYIEGEKGKAHNN